MTLFLTSSFTQRESVGIDPAAGFLDELKKRLPRRLTGVFVCSAPDSFDITDLYGASTADCFKREGFYFDRFTILDERSDAQARQILKAADLIILSGGHVPTQNAYFNKIGLREIMQELKEEPGRVVIGISAGTMNCADTVYAQPEEEGEATDPSFSRYLKGLGLTDINVLPHYYDLKDQTLDGLKILEDIAVPDSFHRPILILPDGSYVLCEEGREEIRGEAWWLRDGVMTPVHEKSGL